MFFMKDEYLHEFQKSADWIESFNVNIIDKKNRIFGFTDIDYLFSKKRVEFNWLFVVNDEIYKYNNFIPIQGKPGEKFITDKKCEYKINPSGNTLNLILKERNFLAEVSLTGMFPVYVFPDVLTADEEKENPVEIKLWERYIQRCRLNGNITVKKGTKNQKKLKVECFAERQHQWGMRLRDRITQHSRIAVQFRDMLMSLSYIEVDGMPAAHGIISRKSGNIPIQNVECEMISPEKEKDEIGSSEFSFTDVHDEVDLVVSKKIHSLKLPVPRNKSRSYVCFRNFSDFTIVGTNKKGVGMEDHYIAIDKLKKF